MEQKESVKAIFGREIPNELIEEIVAHDVPNGSIEALSVAINGFHAKHHRDGSMETTPYHNLLSLLKNKIIARYFIEHPQKLMDYVEQLRKNTGFGAHNAFFTIGLDKVAAMFVADPEIFLELAKRTVEESIGAFPSLKGDLMFQRFKESPNDVIGHYERIAKALQRNAGTVLNKLYEDSLARCFVQDPERFITILMEISDRYKSNPFSRAFTAFNNRNFYPCFSDYFHGKISSEAFFEAVENCNPLK